MNFIEAIIKIHERTDLSLCDDERELTGEYPSICVYKNGDFLGKLRWPSVERLAEVDMEVENELK
jgi:hypothetical protein